MQFTKNTGVSQMPLGEICLERIATNEESHHRKGPLPNLSGHQINQPSNSPKGCQWPGYTTFSLDKDLESLAHPFRVDQRLKLQPRLRALRLGLSLIVDVRKFISLPERQQKSRL